MSNFGAAGDGYAGEDSTTSVNIEPVVEDQSRGSALVSRVNEPEDPSAAPCPASNDMPAESTHHRPQPRAPRVQNASTDTERRQLADNTVVLDPSDHQQPKSRDGSLQVPVSALSASSRTDATEQRTSEVPTSYYFEPQGELLNGKASDKINATEFSIPGILAESVSSWSPSQSLRDLVDYESYLDNTQLPLSTAGVKRKAPTRHDSDSLLMSAVSKRPSLRMTSGNDGQTTRNNAHTTRAQIGPSLRTRSATEATDTRPRVSAAPGNGSRNEASMPTKPRRTLTDPTTPMILPARKVFPIQIGDKLFRLSGASISSDAPSYFSQFFEEQLRQTEGADSVRTLYIDRDPSTFEDISLHLQGYHVQPRDGTHFIRLFADAQFFSLPRLTAQLFASAIYIRIGDSEFQIPRDLFSNLGDSPNYFSLGFAVFFASPHDAFPGLSQRALIRPPSVLPPSVPNRSSKTFADLLHVLKGYPLHIRNQEHRDELLRDARYFHLKGLEQRLIPHQISYNLVRRHNEILIRLEDIRQSGVSFVADHVGNQSSAPSPASSTDDALATPGWIHYQRPYVDSEAYALIIELNGEENMHLTLPAGTANSPTRLGRAAFFRQTLVRITKLFSVIGNKMGLPVTQPLGLMMLERATGAPSLPVSPGNTGVSGEHVKVRVGSDADVIIDNIPWRADRADDSEEESNEDVEVSGSANASRKRRRPLARPEVGNGEELVVTKSQWRLRVQPISGGSQIGRSGMQVILGAVKIEAYRSEHARNVRRSFLS